MLQMLDKTCELCELMLKIRCQSESNGVWREIGLSDVVECAVADLLRLVSSAARSLALTRIFAPFATPPSSSTLDTDLDLNGQATCSNAMRVVARFAMYCAIHAAPSPSSPSSSSSSSLASASNERGDLLELLSQLFNAYVPALIAQQSINIRPNVVTTTQQQQQQDRNDGALIYMHAYRAAATIVTKASVATSAVPASIERLLWQTALVGSRPVASLASSLLAFLTRNSSAAFRRRQSTLILALVRSLIKQPSFGFCKICSICVFS